MKWWRKNTNSERELPSFLKAGLNRVNSRLIAMASFLQLKTNGYSIRKKKILLLLLVIVFATESGVVMVQSITGNCEILPEVNRIKSIPISSDESNAPTITTTEYLKIKKIKSYIDSLSTTAGGRKFKDSLLQHRPQLMDSVNFLMNLYLEQSKIKVK